MEAERKANRYGFCFMRQDLVLNYYWLHRELFLPSHIDPKGWIRKLRFRRRVHEMDQLDEGCYLTVQVLNTLSEGESPN